MRRFRDRRSALVPAAALLLVAGCGGGPDGAADATGADDPPTNVEERPDDTPRFQARDGWVSVPPANAQRMLQFELPGADGAGSAELVVAVWPGDVGGRDANLARWVAQMGLEGGLDAVPADRLDERTVRGFEVSTLYLTGTYRGMGGETKEDAGMLASYVRAPGGERTWTIKALGPTETIERWRTSYHAFVDAM